MRESAPKKCDCDLPPVSERLRREAGALPRQAAARRGRSRCGPCQVASRGPGRATAARRKPLGGRMIGSESEKRGRRRAVVAFTGRGFPTVCGHASFGDSRLVGGVRGAGAEVESLTKATVLLEGSVCGGGLGGVGGCASTSWHPRARMAPPLDGMACCRGAGWGVVGAGGTALRSTDGGPPSPHDGRSPRYGGERATAVGPLRAAATVGL